MTPKERLAELDKFYRVWSAEHDEEYQGYDDFGDFVIYSTKKSKLFGDILELRCDNSHLVERGAQTLTCVRMLDARLLNDAAIGAGDVLSLEKRSMLEECRQAALQPPKEQSDGE